MTLFVILGNATRFERQALRLICTTACFAGLMANRSHAQSITPAEPAPTSAPSGLWMAHGPGSVPRTSAPFQWGYVGLRPHASYSQIWGEGLQARRGQRTSTSISTISLGLLADLGRHWNGDYTASRVLYSSSEFSDALNHNFRLNGQAAFTDGSISFGQTYQNSNDPRIETGRQSKQESSSTSVGVDYTLGPRSGISVGAGHQTSNNSGGADSTTWTGDGGFNYRISPRLNGAAQVTVGYAEVDPGIDMSFVEPNVSLSWSPSPKLGLSANVGREYRRFRKAGSATLETLTYSSSGYYQLFPATSLSLSVQRGANVSYFSDQVNQNTRWSFGVNQRLLTVWNLNASASRSNMRYLPSDSSTVVVIREDTSYSYNLRLSTRFLRRGSVGLVYQHTRNASDAIGYGFSSNQIGLELSYSY